MQSISVTKGHSARFGTQGPGFEPGLFHKACYMPLHGQSRRGIINNPLRSQSRNKYKCLDTCCSHTVRAVRTTQRSQEVMKHEVKLIIHHPLQSFDAWPWLSHIDCSNQLCRFLGWTCRLRLGRWLPGNMEDK